MGSILSRWKKKQSTIEILEGIDKNVLKLEKFRKSNQELKSKIIGNLIIYSVIIYIIACTVLYFLFVPSTWIEQCLQILPFLCFPVLIYLLKVFLHWWFVRKISNNEQQLQALKDQRNEILENVMETETYKKAKEILEKFDPVTKRKLEEERRRRENPPTPVQTPGTELRKRNSHPSSSNSSPNRPIETDPATPGRSSMGSVTSPMAPVNGMGQRMPMTPVLPRPILRQDRSAMEKVVEYFVGDGPNNRYALICKNCYSHNGMALREEFEYIEYRCAYCRFFNPARKHRPNAPRLPIRVNSPMLNRHTATRSSENEDEKEDQLPLPSAAVSSSNTIVQENDDTSDNQTSEPEEKSPSMDVSHGNTQARIEEGENPDETGDSDSEMQCDEVKSPLPNQAKAAHGIGDS